VRTSSISYARIGMPVLLKRNAAGRHAIIGPGDRIISSANVVEIDESDDTVTTGATEGFTYVQQPFSFYQGTTPESFFDPAADPDTLAWFSTWNREGSLPANIGVPTDTDTALVTALYDKSGNGYHAVCPNGVGNPNFRRFAEGVNSLSSVDFSSDGLEIATPIPGEQISIFCLCGRDLSGAGVDVVLQTEEYALCSRISSGSANWGVRAATGFNDSGSELAVGADPVLIEAICNAFDDIDMYQDGTFLATGTTTATGYGAAESAIGYGPNLGSNYHIGRVLEILVIDRVVSNADRQDIEAYFNQLYAVRFALWSDGVNGFPKVSVFDSDGNEV